MWYLIVAPREYHSKISITKKYIFQLIISKK